MRKNIEDFINYAYAPLSKKQCVQNILLIWLASFPVCLLGPHKTFWITSLGLAALAVTVFFVFLIVKRPDLKESKFLCEGISALHLSVLFNLSAYRVSILGSEPKPVLLLIFLLMLLVIILVFLTITKTNIKNGFYSTEKKSLKSSVWPLICGACGIIFARIFLADIIANNPTMFFSGVLLFLSFAVGIGSLNLLKFYYVRSKNGF